MKYLQKAKEIHKLDELNFFTKFSFDFGLPYVSSMVTSIHKWVPCPFPGSIMLVRDKALIDNIGWCDRCIPGKDLTLSNSRNGHSSVLAWDFLARRDESDHINDALYCWRLTKYVYSTLQEIEKKLAFSLNLHFKEPGLNV